MSLPFPTAASYSLPLSVRLLAPHGGSTAMVAATNLAVAVADWQQCGRQRGGSAAAVAAFLQLDSGSGSAAAAAVVAVVRWRWYQCSGCGVGKQHGDGGCSAVLAAAVQWRRWQSGKGSVAAARQ
jgi:hypothetical protein